MIEVDDAGSIEALRQKLLRWARKAPEEVRRVLRIGAMMVQREAQEHHLSGPKMAPGESGGLMWSTLAVQTGRLRRSIAMRVTVKPGEIEALVGTNVPYGRIHELGLRNARGIKMPPRPFLKPSLIVMRPKIFDLIRKAAFESYGK